MNVYPHYVEQSNSPVMIVCSYPEVEGIHPEVKEYYHKACFNLQEEVKEQNEQHLGTAVYEAHKTFLYITEFEKIPSCLRCGESLVLRPVPYHRNTEGWKGLERK